MHPVVATSASSEREGPAPRLPTKVFEGHTDDVKSVAYFRDGARIISGSADKTARIWDVGSQHQQGASLLHDFEVESIALSSDERRLVSGGTGVVLWDLAGRTVVWKTAQWAVDGRHVAYSPDDRLIAAARYFDHGAIVLLDAETGEQVRSPLQLDADIGCLAFSPDGTRIAAGSRKGGVRVFDVATGATVVSAFQPHTDGVTSFKLIYTFDGQQIITASADFSVPDFSIRVWDATTGREMGGPMLGHNHIIWQIVLSSDGRRLASVSHDSTVCVWDLEARRQICGPFQGQYWRSLSSVAWPPDGRSIVAGHTGGGIYLWDVPPLDDHVVIPQAPVPTPSSPAPMPAGSQRANQTSQTSRRFLRFFARPSQPCV